MNRVKEVGKHWQYLAPKGFGKREASSKVRMRRREEEYIARITDWKKGGESDVANSRPNVEKFAILRECV